MASQFSTRLKIGWYRRSWTADVTGAPVLISPTLLVGPGRISLGSAVTFGWTQSPRFYDGYTYVEARDPATVITIGANSHLNNAVTIISESIGITIGQRCLIGPQVQIYDSDFHATHPERRRDGSQERSPVLVGDDVFIGANAIILKGVTVGNGSVIGAGSVVVSDIPAGVIAAGNPARPLGSV